MANIVTANPATIDLDPAPFPVEWIIDGTPEARAREIARSDDATMKASDNTPVCKNCAPMYRPERNRP